MVETLSLNGRLTTTAGFYGADCSKDGTKSLKTIPIQNCHFGRIDLMHYLALLPNGETLIQTTSILLGCGRVTASRAWPGFQVRMCAKSTLSDRSLLGRMPCGQSTSISWNAITAMGSLRWPSALLWRKVVSRIVLPSRRIWNGAAPRTIFSQTCLCGGQRCLGRTILEGPLEESDSDLQKYV